MTEPTGDVSPRAAAAADAPAEARGGGDADASDAAAAPVAPPPPRDGDAAAAAAGVALDDLDCAVCFKLLCEPATLRCGHAFCGACVRAVVAAEAPRPWRCPVCRAPAPAAEPPPATSLLLAALLEKLAPATYAERRLEVAADAASAAAAAAAREALSARASLPLLSLQPPLLPGQRIRLRLAEPRLLRLAHALFAAPPPQRLACTDRRPVQPGAVLTEADVINIAPLRGGAVQLTLRGRRRVALTEAPPERENSDGLIMLQVGPACDETPPDAGAVAELAALAAETRRFATDWAARVAGGGFERTPGQIASALGELGPCPVGDDAAAAERVGLWAAALLTPTPALDIAPDVRSAALHGHDTRARLLLVCDAMTSSMGAMGVGSRATAAISAAVAGAGALADGAARAGLLLSRLWQSRGDAVVTPVSPRPPPADVAAQAQPLGLMPRAPSSHQEAPPE